MIGDRGTEALNRIGERIKALEEERDRWRGMCKEMVVVAKRAKGWAETYKTTVGEPNWLYDIRLVLSAYESALKEGL